MRTLALIALVGFTTETLMYFTGQVLHILLNAYNTVHSKLNSIDTWGAYFKNQGLFIVIRFFLTTMMFLIVWENPKLVNLDALSIGALTKIGAAGLLGYSMDSIFEKIASTIGIAPELPK